MLNARAVTVYVARALVSNLYDDYKQSLRTRLSGAILRRKIMAVVHLVAQPIWHIESSVFEKIVPVLTILFMLGFKV